MSRRLRDSSKNCPGLSEERHRTRAWSYKLTTQPRAGVWASVVAIMLSFAVNSIITRYLVSGGFVDPIPLTIIRFVSGLVALLLLAGLARDRFPRHGLETRDILGAFFLGAYAFAISFGYVAISAAAGSLVFYSMVVITMGSYSVAVDGEALSAKLVASQGLGLMGIFTITFSGLASVSVLGVALMALTGASWGLYSAYGKGFGSYFGYTFNSFLLFGVAGIAIGLLALPFTGTAVWTSISARDLALALYMGTVSTALVYVLWNRVLQRIRASQGGLVQLLVPVMTGILGVTLLSEAVSPWLVLGGALILAGIYVNSTRRVETGALSAP